MFARCIVREVAGFASAPGAIEEFLMPFYMNQFNMPQMRPMVIAKIAAVSFLVIILLTFAVKMFVTTFRSVAPIVGYGTVENGVVAQDAMYKVEGYGEGTMMGAPTLLSERNILPSVPGYVPGTDSEQFEVRDYNALIETRNREKDCAVVADLKAREDVIFESASEYDKGCNYFFKVTSVSANEILDIIRNLDPKELSENTYTIKRQIEDYTSTEDILKNKLATIDETLATAIASYDSIAALATRTLDAEALARIIDSKLQMVERLTQERINITEQLDYVSRAKAEQLDRLDYVFFSVNIVENKYLDSEQIKDSWKLAVKEFFEDINMTLQEVTVGLVALLFAVAQYVLYAFIVLMLAKYGWRVGKAMWKK